MKSRKKILYIITKSIWAGASKYVHDLATSLPQSFEVAIAAGGGGELSRKLKEKNITYFNIKNFQRDVGFLKDLFAFFEILFLLFKIRPDIVHVSSSKAGGLAGPAILIYKILRVLCPRPYTLATIFTAHGWAFTEPRSKIQTKLIKIFSRLTCLFYDKIICVSEFDKQIALKNKIAPAKKLITIHNGIKPEDYNFLPKEEARKKLITDYGLQVTSSELWIGTIGENTKNKGHKYLKEALPSAIIIRNLPQGYKYLKAFDIFVLPSVKEGLPYILIEAGLARLPVIATSVGGVPEIVKDPSEKSGQTTGILIRPANISELTKAIEKLTSDQTLRYDMGFNLWGKINSEFLFNKMLNSTLVAYK